MNQPMVSFGNPPQSMSLESFLARPRFTPYRFDVARIGPSPEEMFVHMIHILAMSAAILNMREVSVIPSAYEAAARARDCQALPGLPHDLYRVR